LYQFLANLAESERPTTFTEIEQVLGFPLPAAAHKHQAWWANNAKNHTHAQAWLDAGWKTSKANLIEESVVFVRTRGSQHSAGTSPIRRSRKAQRDYRPALGAAPKMPVIAVAGKVSDVTPLLHYVFAHGAVIELDRGSDGAPLEFMPQSKYSGADTMRLNRYGAGPFCRFTVQDLPRTSGVYALTIDGVLAYVGLAKDLAQRWGPQGYANISPRACYVGGQSTNCKVNNRILISACNGQRIDLWIHETFEPEPVEARLIHELSPPWNDQQPKAF
jgi:hypothetical protein